MEWVPCILCWILDFEYLMRFSKTKVKEQAILKFSVCLSSRVSYQIQEQTFRFLWLLANENFILFSVCELEYYSLFYVFLRALKIYTQYLFGLFWLKFHVYLIFIFNTKFPQRKTINFLSKIYLNFSTSWIRFNSIHYNKNWKKNPEFFRKLIFSRKVFP